MTEPVGHTDRSEQASREGVRLLVGHKKDCWFHDPESDPAPFVVYDRTVYGKNKNGVGRGGHTWHIFRCNDPRCPAQAGVRWDVLANLIGRGG